MIISGIDWSGDTGDPAKSRLNPVFVTAIAHIGISDLPLLTSILDDVRSDRGLPARFVFRHSSTADPVRRAFFEAMSSTPVAIRAHLSDKRTWPRERFKERSIGPTAQLIADLICQCPSYCIAGQLIRIDLNKDETKTLRIIQSVIKQSLRGVGIEEMPSLRAVPDHRADGVIVQVADMFAGAINQAGGVRGPYLSPLQKLIDLK